MRRSLLMSMLEPSTYVPDPAALFPCASFRISLAESPAIDAHVTDFSMEAVLAIGLAADAETQWRYQVIHVSNRAGVG